MDKTLDLFSGWRRSYILPCLKFSFGCFPSNEKVRGKTIKDGKLFFAAQRDVLINNNAEQKWLNKVIKNIYSCPPIFQMILYSLVSLARLIKWKSRAHLDQHVSFHQKYLCSFERVRLTFLLSRGGDHMASAILNFKTRFKFS